MMGFRRRFAIAVLFGAAFGGAFLACGYDWDFVDADGGGSDASLANDAGDAASLGDSASDALRTGDVGTGGTCTSSGDCDAFNYCVFPDHLCGGIGVTAALHGTCQPIPACTGGTAEIIGDLICGCDGISYLTACAAAGQRQDLNANTSACLSPGDASVFQCRYAYCQRGTNFCVTFADSGAECERFSCAGPDNCSCALGSTDCDGGCVAGSGVVGVDAAALTVKCN